MSLYETDFYAWTREQAAALRRVADLRINLPGVDLAHVIEEIEDMGNDTLEKIEGLVVQIIVHLLKLAHSHDPLPRNHWRVEVTAWRQTVLRRAKRSPTVLRRLDVEELAVDALDLLREDDRYREWAATLPDRCPFTLDQVLDKAFVPEPTRLEKNA